MIMKVGAALYVAALAALARGAQKDGAVCSGHGATSADDPFVCQCMSGYTGPDCSQRSCPHGVAWADYPTAIFIQRLIFAGSF